MNEKPEIVKIEITKEELELLKECIRIRLKNLEDVFEDIKTPIKHQQTIVDIGVIYEKLLNKLEGRK